MIKAGLGFSLFCFMHDFCPEAVCMDENTARVIPDHLLNDQEINLRGFIYRQLYFTALDGHPKVVDLMEHQTSLNHLYQITKFEQLFKIFEQELKEGSFDIVAISDQRHIMLI